MIFETPVANLIYVAFWPVILSHEWETEVQTPAK